MLNNITITGAVFICLSILLGAMAAHGLENVVSENLIDTFEKGVKYQMYTGIGLLILGLNGDKFEFKLNAFYALNLIGVFLFSGSIYVYTFHEHIEGLRTAALIVPFGGVAMILAWVVLIVQLIRQK